MLLGFLSVQNKSSYSYIYIAGAIILIIGAIVYSIYMKLKWVYIVVSIIVMAASFLLGAYNHELYLRDLAYFDDIEGGQSITLQGKLTHIDKKNTSYYLYFNNIVIDDQTIDPRWSVILMSDSDELSIGSIARIRAEKLEFIRASNEGSFDEKKYYNSLGVIGKTKGRIVDCIVPEVSVSASLHTLRDELKSVIISSLPGEEGGVMSAMCLGDKADLDRQLKELFTLSGLAHILAISGLHISIVGMSIYKFLRRRGITFFSSGVISIIIVIAYAIMCDGSVSTIRAAGMFIIMIIANILGKGVDTLTSIALMLMYVIIVCPYGVESGGFIFSFVAVTGIAMVVSPITSIYDKYIRLRFLARHQGESFAMSIGEHLTKGLLSSVLIWLVTLPIVCYYYYEIPTYVIALNLIVIPLMGVLVGSTLLGAITGCIAIGVLFASDVMSLISDTLMWITHVIIYMYEFLSYNTLRLPGSRIITGRPTIIEIMIYYIILLVATRLVLYYSKNLEDYTPRDLIRYRRRLIGIATLAICIVISIVNNDNRLRSELDMLDVGQGDGIYLGGGDANYFFDGGSTSVNEVGKYRILPFLKYKGIRRIDYWFVSHVDSDHISGLVEALESSYPIKYIVVDEYMLGAEGYRLIEEQAKRSGTDIIVMKKGDMVVSDRFKLQCIFAGDDAISDINANSLVMLVECTNRRGRDDESHILIGGDMTAESEKLIEADKSVDISKLDILKVAHHGSKTSSSKEFIEMLRPRISLISAGRSNSYGHPHEITLDTLRSVDSLIYRTDTSGRILVDLYAKKVLTFY